MSSPAPQRSRDSFTSPTYSPSSKSGFPFPSHASSQRTNTGGRYRRGSAGSIASSVGGTLDSTGGSQVTDLTQNAISTLLAHPIVRTGLIPQNSIPTSGHKPPSTRDIPPVTLTNIPHVDPSTFKSYLAQAGPLYENYQRAKAASDEPTNIFPRDGDASRTDAFADAFERSMSSAPGSPTFSRRTSNVLSPLSPPTSPSVRVASRSGTPRRGALGPTPLSTIPNVYFEEDFHLENPRTFDIVSERSDVIPGPPPGSKEENAGSNGAVRAPGASGRKALHTNAILQEKLSWYMDTVEVHLITSIASASTSFFAALGSLKELQQEATDSIFRIKSLRAALKQLDTEMAVGGLEIVNMRRRRENLRKLGDAVTQLCEVVEDAKNCEDMVDEGKLEEATQKISGLERLISGDLPRKAGDDGPPRIDLTSLNALRGVSIGISDLRFRIGKGFEARFVDALLADLRQHVQSVPSRNTLQRWAAASMRSRGEHRRAQSGVPAFMQTNDQLRPELLSSLEGLSKAAYTGHAASAYRDAIMREIKSLIRRHLPSSSDDDAESMTSISTRGGNRINQQEKSRILARNLRALEGDAAEELLVKIYTSVGEALRRIGYQVKTLLDVTSTMEDTAAGRKQRSPPGSPDPQARMGSISMSVQDPSGEVRQIREDVMQALDLSNLLGQAVDVIQGQVNKVLKVRVDQSARLPLQQFLRYFTLNLLFADECEAVSSRSGASMKEIINNSVREFLPNLAETEKQRANKVLDEDIWDARDFTPADNTVLSRVLESMTQTPKAWSQYTQLWDDGETNGTTPTTVNGGNNTTAVEKQTVRPATIDEQKYIVVNSTLAALHSIDTFQNLMAGIPSLTPDVAYKLVDYLKNFNSRCCQLILGAGATRSAGLKNITTKHLALASQTCSFVVAMVPYIREFVRRQSPSSASTVLPEFDKVKRLFQDHQVSIHEKLVEIMSQRCSAHVKAMKRIDWDSDPGTEKPNPYMEALTKETGTLHRVLSKHVGEIDLQMVMIPICRHYETEWTRAFEEASVKTQAGKTRMLRDLDLLDSKLTKIDGFGEVAAILRRIVNEKKVESFNANSEVTESATNGATEKDSGVKEPEPSTDPVVAEAVAAKAGQPSNESLEVPTSETAVQTRSSAETLGHSVTSNTEEQN